MCDLNNYSTFIIPCVCKDLDHNVIVYKRKDMDEDSYLEDYYIIASVLLNPPEDYFKDSLIKRFFRLKDLSTFQLECCPSELSVLEEIAILLDWKFDKNVDDDFSSLPYYVISGKVPNYKFSLWEKLQWLLGWSGKDMRISIGEWDGEQYIQSWLE